MDIPSLKKEIDILKELENINELLIEFEEDKLRFLRSTQHHLTLVAEGEWNRKNGDILHDLLHRKHELKKQLCEN